jgi:WD40 repeat protein
VPRRVILAVCLSLLGGLPAFAWPRVGTDDYGDPLPDGAVARLGSRRFRVELLTDLVTLSPDGKTLIAARERRGAVRFLDAATGKELRDVQLPVKGDTTTLSCSADGSFLVTIDNEAEIILWEAATGTRLHKWQAPDRGCQLAFCRGGQILVARGDFWKKEAVLRVWSTATGRELPRLEPLHQFGLGAEPSPDGKLLATWGVSAGKAGSEDQAERDRVGRTVQLWDLATGQELRRLEVQGFKAWGGQVAFSADAKVLAVAVEGGAVSLWDVAEGKELRRLAGPPGAWVKLAFAADGKALAAADTEGGVTLWDLPEGKKRGSCAARVPVVRTLGFLADGTPVAAGVRGQELRLWEVPSGRLLSPEEGHPADVGMVRFTPNGRSLVSASLDGTVCLWDLRPGANPAERITAKQRRRCELQRNPSGEFMEFRFSTFALSPDGKRLAGADSGSAFVRLWDVPSFEAVGQVEGPGGWVTTFSPDGKLLTGANRNAGVWDVASGRHLWRAEDSWRVAALAFSPDGQWLAEGGDRSWEGQEAGMVRVVSSGTGKERWSLSRPGTDLDGLAFSGDGRLLVIATREHGLSLCDAASGQEVRALEQPAGDGWLSWAPVCSPDGRLVAASAWNQNKETGRVITWEAASGAIRQHFGEHEEGILAPAFAPDGRTLAASGHDTTVLLWDLRGPGPRDRAALSEKELDSLWSALGAKDGGEAYRAILRLAAAPAESVPLLRQRVRPAAAPDAREVERLIADLDRDDFTVRERASRGLEQFGTAARGFLTRALEADPSPEKKRRLQALLKGPEPWAVTPEELRALRAVEALERAATPEARRLLEELAAGRSDAALTRDARAALERLGRP